MGGCKGARGVGGLYKKYKKALANISYEVAQHGISLLIYQDIELLRELINDLEKQSQENELLENESA